ncbi:hypothetical protein DXG01_003739 [Tephrocybe rancida]|nr:hypothetical protein DXG01_003739 [Tephrocybe rancida]
MAATPVVVVPTSHVAAPASPPPKKTYSRPLTQEYASACQQSQVTRTACLAIETQQNGVKDAANAVKNTILVLFWTKINYFIPKEQPLLMGAVPNGEQAVATLDSYPGEGHFGTWMLQDFNVPVCAYTLGDGQGALMCAYSVEPQQCQGLHKEALQVPALLKARQYARHLLPPTPTPATAAGVPHAHHPLTPTPATTAAAGLPPTPAPTPTPKLTPNAPKPTFSHFPPCSLGTTKKETKFKKLFPGVNFARSTFNRHTLIYHTTPSHLKSKYRSLPDALWDEFCHEAKDCSSTPDPADILNLTSDNDKSATGQTPPQDPPSQDPGPTNAHCVISTGSLAVYVRQDMEINGEMVSVIGDKTPAEDVNTQFFIDLTSNLACPYGFKNVYKGYHMLPDLGVLNSDAKGTMNICANPVIFKAVKPHWNIGHGIWELGVQIIQARETNFEILEGKLARPQVELEKESEFILMEVVEGRFLEDLPPMWFHPNTNLFTSEREPVHNTLDALSHYAFQEAEGKQVITHFQGRFTVNGECIKIFDFDIHTWRSHLLCQL